MARRNLIAMGRSLHGAASMRRGWISCWRIRIMTASRLKAQGASCSARRWARNWWMKGTRYGVVGSVATPFWEMYVGAWFTTRNLPDGNYEVRLAGANFYTAPGDDDLLKRFANPYTGRTVEVPYMRPKATNTVYDLKGGNPFGSSGMPGRKAISSMTAADMPSARG